MGKPVKYRFLTKFRPTAQSKKPSRLLETFLLSAPLQKRELRAGLRRKEVLYFYPLRHD
jgi:hypothetical protein